MMNPEDVRQNEETLAAIVEEVRAFCLENSNPAVVQKYARYFKEGYDGYGISNEVWRANGSRFYEKYRNRLDRDAFLRLGNLLFESGKYEEGSFAILSVKPFLRDFDALSFQAVGEWLEKGVRNWAHTDVICSELLSPCLKNGVVAHSGLADWRESTSKWKRRAVPVALLGLINRVETPALLAFIRPLMIDPERVVHQGLGWFLREAWKKDPDPVETFLLEWKDKAARLIFQYATEKMTLEQKARFRKSKG
jgi:3-methyladenine DNA glycosylase AlkD